MIADQVQTRECNQLWLDVPKQNVRGHSAFFATDITGSRQCSKIAENFSAIGGRLDDITAVGITSWRAVTSFVLWSF